MGEVGERLDKVQERLGGVEQRLGSVETGLKEVREEVGGLRGEVGGLRGEVGGLRGEVGGLRGEVGELRHEVNGFRILGEKNAEDIKKVAEVQLHHGEKLDEITKALEPLARIDAFVTAVAHEHERRITALEDHTGIPKADRIVSRYRSAFLDYDPRQCARSPPESPSSRCPSALNARARHRGADLVRSAVITGATLINPNRRSRSELGHRDRLAPGSPQVGPAAGHQPPAGAEIIDARGKFVMPGLADMHNHLDDGGINLQQNRVANLGRLLAAGSLRCSIQTSAKEISRS